MRYDFLTKNLVRTFDWNDLNQNRSIFGEVCINGRKYLKTGVTTSTTDYYIIAYPSKLGALSKIVMNDATPLLADGFTSQKLTVTDPVTLKSLEYIIYTSVQKGAFTNAKLTID